MHTAEDIVHAKIGHHDAEESHEHIEVVDHRAAEGGEALRVEHYGINHKSDECPCFLGVPTPIGPPTDVGPNGADEDTHPHGGDGGIEEQAAQHLQGFQAFGAQVALSLRNGVARQEMDDNGRERTDEGERQQSVAHHDDAHMNRKQR